ncbi:MAG: rod shape-determining protein MreC [Planctomycetota bacterium]|nr:MAG: rod shape-determining protein MreC [Planctomycetota bacterium]
MAKKQFRLSRQMLFTYLLLAGFIFLFAPQNLTKKLQFAFARIFCRPLSIGRNISLSARAQQVFADVVSRREYNKLQNHLANVTKELLEKNQKLEELSGLRSRLQALEGAKLLLADVITASINGSRCELIINRGEDDELAEGQFVLGENSIIGTITDVTPRTAKTKLITDPTSKMAVYIRKSKTVIQGNGRSSAKVKLLSIEHKVKTGDYVYAARKSGLLDTPIVVGTVAQCKRDDENPMLWDIIVKPVCDIKKINEVAVIIMNPQH